MKIKRTTLNRLLAVITNLRESEDESDTVLVRRINKEARKRRERDIHWPYKKYGLPDGQTWELLKAKNYKDSEIDVQIKGWYIENLAYFTGNSIKNLLELEDFIQFIPAFIEDIAQKIKKKNLYRKNGFSTIISNNSLSIYILKLTKPNLDFKNDKIIRDEDDIDAQFLREVYNSSKDAGEDLFDIYLMEKENRFRKYNAKLKSEIGTDKAILTHSFIDDRDMNGDFELFVVTNPSKTKVYYSCRTFSNLSDVNKEVEGQKGTLSSEYDQEMYKASIEFAKKLEEQKKRPFVIDRLAGGSKYEYRQLIGYAKTLLYCVIMKYHIDNGNDVLVCLARREKANLLLKEYLKYGLNIVGINFYKIGKKELSHWVLSSPTKKILRELSIFGSIKTFLSSNLL